MADWTSDSNDSLLFSLGMCRSLKWSATTSVLLVHAYAHFWTPVRSQKDKEALAEDEAYEEFNPSFTYPVWHCISWFLCLLKLNPLIRCFQIYGEDEKIYGYRDLVIDVKNPIETLRHMQFVSHLSSCALHLGPWSNIWLCNIRRSYLRLPLWMM